MGPEFQSITDLIKIFIIIFKRNPTTSDIPKFRSFQGLLQMMKTNLDPQTIKIVIDRFEKILEDESVSPDEVTAIESTISNILT